MCAHGIGATSAEESRARGGRRRGGAVSNLAGPAAERATCARCEAVLARDHAGEALCSPCAAAAPIERLRILEPEELAFAVGGVLLLYRGLRPGVRVPVRQVLARLRISAEPWEIHKSVEKWRSRGMVIDARERRRGYRAVDLLVPFVRPFHRSCSPDPRQTSFRVQNEP